VPIRQAARAACRRATGDRGNEQTCVRVHGGWSVHDPRMGAQGYNRWASVYLDDGFRMWVLINSSGQDKGSGTAGPPPLDVPVLERVATSDLWFG
jgi:hypothetical protein